MSNAFSLVLKGLKKTQNFMSLRGEKSNKNNEQLLKQKDSKIVNAAREVGSPNKQDNSARQLRSNDTKATTKDNDYLFQFDLNYQVPDYSFPLKLDRHSEPIVSSPVVGKHRKRNGYCMIEKYESGIDATLQQDPLNDELFGIHHRRKEREEKRMQNDEKQKNEVEVDRLERQKGQLLGPKWQSSILNLTKIVNPEDEGEMDKKRTLTLQEIDLYLNRFKEWKKKEVGLKSKTDFEDDYYVHDPNNLTMLTPRKKRRLQPSEPFTSFFKNNEARRASFNQLVRRPDRRGQILAFGHTIPKMVEKDFELPSHIRSM